ncbi:MAG: error-prone DNA polymerase, partial [Planctomycetota bacterium]|nr:error-prone DNA polymerase [Planctomycetota bacterium]
ATPTASRATAAWPYAELSVTSNFTFLTGASHPEEFVARAGELGHAAVALTDTNTLGGIVRAHVAAREPGMPRFVVGCRLVLEDLRALSVLVYPTGMAGYRALCRTLTAGKRRAPKGACSLTRADLPGLGTDVVAIASLARPLTSLRSEIGPEHVRAELREVRDLLGGPSRVWLGLCAAYGARDAEHLHLAHTLARELDLPTAAINEALHHTPERRMLADVLACIRAGTTLASAGRLLHAHAERHLKAPEEMHRLFSAFPRALEGTMEIAERTRGFSLDELRYEYPDEVVPAGVRPIDHLRDLTMRGARERYPAGVPAKVRAQIEHELALIEDLRYEKYFLTVHDLVRFARSRTPPILCQGRGAAANSAVCFCLGITAVDPDRIDVLFERFVSRERNEPPDIDIDFEHQRREEVIQYLYRTYGRDRAALTAEVISYRRRSAVRDVGKALGFSLDTVDKLAKDLEWWDDAGIDAERARAMGLNPDEPAVKWLVRLSAEILGFPRHRSQHVGGFIMTRTALSELVPVENAAMADRTVVEWDKDDVDAMGMLKVDVLGLGMLSCIRRALELVSEKLGREVGLADVPAEDRETYAMIQRADTVGVFQIESRAQMSMLPRLRPACFYDLVIEVAIVRPGPIQGDMVHPYLRRRNGEERVSYPHPSVERVLSKTLGVPLFQEQCMLLAIHAAGFTPGEADQLRRAMAAWKRKGDAIYRFGQKIIDGMISRGIDAGFARQCFEQIKGFSEYGFPESHAASFALLVYASCWLKRHHPAEFTCALLNSQPMGFYGPAQLIRDVTNHGVRVLPVDVHHSRWDCTIERGALRLGLRMVSGLGEEDGLRIERAVRSRGTFASVANLWRASGASARAVRRLAAADAFGSMGLDRRRATWEARALRDEELPLFDSCEELADKELADDSPLPDAEPVREVRLDYEATGLSLKAHPVSFARAGLRRLGAITCAEMNDERRTPEGAFVTIAGLVLVRQRPGTAEGVTFMTLEDESGAANLVVWKRIYLRDRRHAKASFVLASGRVQRQSGVMHLIVSRLRRMTLDPSAEHGSALTRRVRNFR